MNKDLQGKTVVITGASTGIGAAAAHLFGERGATVAVVGRSPDKTAAGAEPMLHLATTEAQTVNGAYFNRLTREDPTNAQAHDPHLAERLWDRSAELTRSQTIASPPHDQ